jgi:hypothetical protein
VNLEMVTVLVEAFNDNKKKQKKGESGDGYGIG